MGACYDVEMYLIPKDVSSLINLIKRFIDETKSKVIYNLEGKDLNSLEDLINIFLPRNYEKDDNFYTASFDASYGWESVMTDLFEFISEALGDKSFIKIWIDNDYDEIVIENGKALWKN